MTVRRHCRRAAAGALAVLLAGSAAVAAPKSPALIPSIQAPAQRAAPQTAPKAPQDAPVMLPVTTAQLSPEIQKNLKLLTGQNSLEARQIGAAGLLQQGSAAVAALRQLLEGQPAPLVVQAIAQAILEIKDPPAELVDPLVRFLAAEDPVRTAVVAALAGYRDHDLPAKLRTVASSAENPQSQRLAAVTVLSRLADRDAIATLIDLLTVSDEAVRQAALTAVCQLTGVNYGLNAAQWQRWWETNRNRKPQEWATEVIASLTRDKDALQEELKVLRKELARAQRELYYAGAEADRPERIIFCLRHTVADVRSTGIDLINGLIGDGRPVPAKVIDQIRQLIKEPATAPEIRAQAIGVLGYPPGPEDGKLLLEAHERETDPAVQQAIAKAFGRLNAPEAVPVLLGRLEKADPALAAAAAAGLGQLCQRGSTTVPPLTIDQVVEALQRRMNGATDQPLREALLEAMARMADERFRGQFEKALAPGQDPASRQIAIKAFADLGVAEDAEKIIRPQLSDQDPGIRAAACSALSKIGDLRQLGMLIERSTEQAETSATVRRAARDAAVSIMLRMDAVTLDKELQQLAASPAQVLALASVLEKAYDDATSQNADSTVQNVLLQSLASARYGAGQKDIAVWVKVITTHPSEAAINTLAKVLIEVSDPERSSIAIQQIASRQNGALTGMLVALGREAKAAHAAGQAASLAALAGALRKMDTSAWPRTDQDALQVFIQTCAQPGPPQAASTTAPAASAPATMAHSPAVKAPQR